MVDTGLNLFIMLSVGLNAFLSVSILVTNEIWYRQNRHLKEMYLERLRELLKENKYLMERWRDESGDGA